jgi:hypothetical protein
MKSPRSSFLRHSLFVLLSSFGLLHSSLAEDASAHTVIVPYDAKLPITAQKAARYYLPYADFQKLWQQAKTNRRPIVEVPDKQEALIHSALYQARVEERSLVITAKLEVASRGHWTKLPLLFQSGASSLLVGDLMLDGKASALKDGSLVFENPGIHEVTLTASLPLAQNWQTAGLTLPPALASLIAVQTPKSDGWLSINGSPALSVEEMPDARLFTAALGDQTKLTLERGTRGLASMLDAAATSASVNSTLYILDAAYESVKTRLSYDFPGSSRRSVSFRLDAAKQRLTSLSAELSISSASVPIQNIRISTEGSERLYEVTLAREIPNHVELRLEAQMIDASARALSSPRPSAARTQETLSLSHDAFTEVKALPTANQRRIELTSKPGFKTIGYTQTTHEPLAFFLSKRTSLSEAAVDYVFQLSPQKIELIAALSLQRKTGSWTQMRLTLPPGGYEVQSITGPALQTWQHEGEDVFLHFLPEIAAQDARLVIHLARTATSADSSWTLQPLQISGFEKYTGRILITAHAASEVRLPTLPTGTHLKEIDVTVLDSVIAIAPPIEKKRALEYDEATWKLTVPLTPQAARFTAETVALVLTADSGLRLSQQVAFQVTQGALRQATVRLPAALPEAVVTGPQLRELRSRIQDTERIYDITFQTDILDHTELTFDHDLPLSATLDVPFVKVEAAERLTRFFLTDNVSAREASISAKTALETVTGDALPFLPVGLARPQFFRATGDGTLKLAFQQLTATEANAALVTLADITSVLRADGERWDTITYSLLNRTLQFLPVKLDPRAELISASVNDEPVRADEEKRADGAVKLVPLIQTKPGQRALTVQLVCRFRSAEKQLPAESDFDDPELPGLSIERTTWSVWSPKGSLIHDFDGNMEEVGEEGRELQKLEGMLSELGDVNRELATGKLSYTDANDAYIRANGLAEKVQQAKRTLRGKANSVASSLLSNGRYEEKAKDNAQSAQDEMDLDVQKQQSLLTKNWGDYEGKVAKPSSEDKAGLKQETQWTPNIITQPIFSTRKASNTFSDSLTANGGNAVLNDNIALNNGFFDNNQGSNTYTGTTTNSATGSLTLNSGSVASNATVGFNSINIGNARANSLSNAAPSDNGFSKKDDFPKAESFVKRSQSSPAVATVDVRGGFSHAEVAPAPTLSAEAPLMGSDPFGGPPPTAQELTIQKPASTSLQSITSSAQGGFSMPAPAAPPLNFNTPGSLPAKADAFMDSERSREPRLTPSTPKPSEMAQHQAQTAEFLRPTGRRSLIIAVPTEGEVRHFSKLKDHAVLSIQLKHPWPTSTRWHLTWLSLALVLGFLTWPKTRQKAQA